MPAKPPLPSVQAFLVCRQIIEDARTHELIIVGPANGIALSYFPQAFTVSVFGYLTGGHGTYQLALELRYQEGTSVGRIQLGTPLKYDNPLQVQRIVLHDVAIEFPAPGRFDLVLLANDEDLARQALELTGQRPTPNPTPPLR